MSPKSNIWLLVLLFSPVMEKRAVAKTLN